MKYQLRLKPDFPAPRRVRAGVQIPARQSVVVELTDDQVTAIKNDPEIIMREVTTDVPDPAGQTAPKPAAKKPAKKQSGGDATHGEQQALDPTTDAKREMVDRQEEKTA